MTATQHNTKKQPYLPAEQLPAIINLDLAINGVERVSPKIESSSTS